MAAMFERLGAWFLTEVGKKVVYGASLTGAIGVFCAGSLPHTLLLDQYQDIVHLYKNGLAVKLSEKVKDRFNKTLQLLEIPEIDKKQFKPFPIFGFDVFSAGTFYSRFGVIIGIPINFTYIDNDNIDKSSIKINNESISWETDEAQLLLRALQFSEKAQMYAIAREIEMRKTPKVLIDTFFATSTYILAYGTGTQLNTKFNLYSKPRSIRLIMYGLLGAFALINYALIKDFTQVYYEKQVDEYLSSKNTIFQEGGKEFYGRILSRNIALRGLLGKAGESKYTTLGNENYLLRQKHLPLVQRKAFFEENVNQVA